jgi:2-methylisocitrate lyase-like PEP mutase family enzyme
MTVSLQDKAKAFGALHRKGDPVVLFNAWDAGSARTVAEAGAKAIATGSYSVALANGFSDGETLALDLVLANAARIASAVSLPVTLDFESGYADDPAAIARNIGAVMDAGIAGANIEDQVIGQKRLRPAKEQAERLSAVRRAAEAKGVPFFINARTDVFLQAPRETHSAALLADALERGRVYAEAGASGLFMPGLVDSALIREACEASPLPVNIMMMAGAPPVAELRTLGVARISYGGGPYRIAMAALKEAATAALTA